MTNDKKESNVWLPNQLSAVKLFLIQIECSINEVYEKLDNKTLYEHTIINKDYSGIIEIIPEFKNSPIFDEYKKMLPLDDKVEFLYQSVYKRTGGVLNLFHSEIKESMDTNLKELINKNEDKNKAIDLWKNMKSELWSSLSPKLVWAGGGRVEKELLLEFCNRLTKIMGDKRFYSQGSALIKAIEFLRAWQLAYNPICNGRPMDAIIKEREEIYERKIKFLKEMNIECDF
ncbi:hypothetical protein BD780_002088 [Clostridium tetanomorphum]|uniref:hypothetical protein n=1 Tax=Clostridium tetanomorphum TaxID=1553 RepID=UPI000447216F|nr:hypothetical protein [Clostridium tetanomorphum]KAJ52787.1 hypothetical protein CTM_05620 [Clostridium tetanomorphum DSM 665]MBP1865370.1 hypothetical protein [Clostridium tetanomorphum]NRS84863.1 hypothetical protein [Clostridium tetanomorphum]SQB91622.1 Uncharacterised protein [Clostridium tetanomorphum]